YQNGDILILVDEVENFLRLVAFTDDALGGEAGDAIGARAETVERRVRLFMRFRAHDVSDAEPLLVTVLQLDHAKHYHAAADAHGPAGGVIDRPVAFLGLVDDDQEFGLVAGLIAAPLTAHGSSLGGKLPPLGRIVATFW